MVEKLPAFTKSICEVIPNLDSRRTRNGLRDPDGRFVGVSYRCPRDIPVPMRREGERAEPALPNFLTWAPKFDTLPLARCVPVPVSLTSFGNFGMRVSIRRLRTVLPTIFCCLLVPASAGCQKDTTPTPVSPDSIDQFLQDNPDEAYSSDGLVEEMTQDEESTEGEG